MNSAAATPNVGAIGSVSNNRLDGMWVNTIVFTKPMRRASQAATKCDSTVIIRAATNKSASSASLTPKRAYR